MIDHVWTVICSRSVIDKDSGNISLQNVLEQLNIFAEPSSDAVIPIEFEVVSFWARTDVNTPSHGRSRLSILSPSGETINTMETEVDLSNHERNRHRTRFQGLPAREPGRHIFRIELQLDNESDWQQVANIPLRLVFSPPENEQSENNLS